MKKLDYKVKEKPGKDCYYKREWATIARFQNLDDAVQMVDVLKKDNKGTGWKFKVVEPKLKEW